MNGLKVACPLCRRKLFETTDQFTPDITPHGGMVRFLGGYHIDWLTTPATKVSEMTCPECLAQLAPSGVLCVLYPPSESGEFFREHIEATTPSKAFEDQQESPIPKVGKPVYICEVCGKEFKTPLALAGHMRSHKEK